MNLLRLENLLVWGAGWLGSFCVLESLALWWPGCPWDTFSRAVWDLQTRWEWVTVPVVAAIAILLFHLSRFAGIQEGDRLAMADKRLREAQIRIGVRRAQLARRRRILEPSR